MLSLVLPAVALGMFLGSFSRLIELPPLVGFLVMMFCQLGFIITSRKGVEG